MKYKVKEKYFSDNDMYKVRVARFTPQKNPAGLRVSCAWGVLLANDRLQTVADIIVEFDGAQKNNLEEAEKFLRRVLAGKNKFILEEADFAQRLDQLRGCFNLQTLAAYDARDAYCALHCHLPWQLYGVNKLWAEIALRGAQRTLLRQLRVKLRRLRSTLTFFKSLVPAEEATHWQGVLKARTNLLGDVREYDVALMHCAKIKTYALNENCETDNACTKEETAIELAHLESTLNILRARSAESLEKNLRLNAVTLELALLELWLRGVKPQKEISLENFLRRRFLAWEEKLAATDAEIFAECCMENLHNLRIKLKRFRYALQSVPELGAAPRLLRSLKYLQDMLGLVHDAYINRQMLDDVQNADSERAELRCEAALFDGWAQAKADAALTQLPAQWEDFCALLKTWREENL